MNAPMTTVEITQLIAETLRGSEVGRARHAAKRVAEAGASNIRSAQNWIEGRCAPNVATFVNLCRELPEMKALALRLVEAEDAIDPEFARRMDRAVEEWLALKARIA